MSPAKVRTPLTLDRIVGPLAEFLRLEAAGGIVLLVATAGALIVANSPIGSSFLAIWKTEFGTDVGPLQLIHPLKHWINDGLMTIFFFVIGLEVKRELVLGELRDLRAAALAIVAAAGGMVVPAALYLALQAGEPGAHGWGIPMATDIAFVVGCLAILGPRVPVGLRVLLLSLAIADDIGAILVIAIGYASDVNPMALALGVIGLGIVVAMARLGVQAIWIYCVAGVLIWIAFHESGVHATISGVLLGLITPATGENAPLPRLEHALHPWVSFGIMPVFALANAGVPISMGDLQHPVAIAVMVGLGLGKPVGILLFSWVAVRLGLAKLPAGVTWPLIGAGGILAGIGFTMAIFIAGLALENELLTAAKIGILLISAICAVAGCGLIARLIGPAPGQPSPVAVRK